MKLNKSTLISVISIIFISFCFLFTSCQSFSLIPGHSNKVFNNIYVEYVNIGDTYYKLEDYTNAIKYYNMALQNKTIYWDVYYKLAKVYAISSNWDQALPMFLKLQKRDPDNTAIKASIAYIYSMQGKIEEAKNIYEELLEIEPVNEKYLENYIALQMPDIDSYINNKSKVDESLNKLKTNFPDNKNIERFESSIREYTKNEEVEEENLNEEYESKNTDEDESTESTE
ncbi:MAG: hypothetical protein K6C97_00490 [Treponema sp.]|nr:hypothetical protein [Treponema sp.]